MPNRASPAGPPLNDGDLLAAVDLGSNSFRLVVARYSLERLHVVDSLRENVRLAAGLTASGDLLPEKRQEALACLSRFGQRLKAIPPGRVRAVATHTFRRMRSPQPFQQEAEAALGHGIEVVSGREEARLIYQGVIQGIPESGRRRLVIDIGGGSTEFIIGEHDVPLATESVQVGCVATTLRFFADGRLGDRRWKAAVTEVAAELQQFAADYLRLGWGEVIGSSGTVKAICRIAQAAGWCDRGITIEALERLRHRLLQAERIEDIDLPSLSAERRQVLPGGLVVLEAAFQVLGIRHLGFSETAMREGVLHDLLGRAQHRDPREASITALARRYSVDVAQAARVEDAVFTLFDSVAATWSLGDTEADWLAWAARVHEVGLAIAHSQYHVHGAYLLAHSDLAGFTRGEQQILALLVRCHRRQIPVHELRRLPGRLQAPVTRLVVLLRLATLLHRPHGSEALPPLQLQVDGPVLRLRLSREWLETHPLTALDLARERKYLKALGFRLETA